MACESLVTIILEGDGLVRSAGHLVREIPELEGAEREGKDKRMQYRRGNTGVAGSVVGYPKLARRWAPCGSEAWRQGEDLPENEQFQLQAL